MLASNKHFTYEERLQIKELLAIGTNKCEIARQLGVHNSSIYREILRGTPVDEDAYNPDFAQAEYDKKLKRKGRPVGAHLNKDVAEIISHLILEQHMSPERIIDFLDKEGSFTDYPRSKNTIYAAIDANLIPNVTRESLNSDLTTMFSNGMICVPKWIREKFHIYDGDKLQYVVSDDGKIYLQKFPSDL